MSESQENSEKQKNAEGKLSSISELLNANAEYHNTFSGLARAIAKSAMDETEQLHRSQDALDRALLNGDMSAEQAREKLERIQQQRQEVRKDLREAAEFIAQSNRDSASTQTLMVTRMMEKGKLDYDFHKHFTTLGTGSLLFIATLVRVIFPEVSKTEALPLLYASLALLAFSVLTSALAMKGATLHVVTGESSKGTERVHGISDFCFSNGLFAFVIYVGINMAGVTIHGDWMTPLALLGGAAIGGAFLPRFIQYVVKKVRKPADNHPS